MAYIKTLNCKREFEEASMWLGTGSVRNGGQGSKDPPDGTTTEPVGHVWLLCRPLQKFTFGVST